MYVKKYSKIIILFILLVIIFIPIISANAFSLTDGIDSCKATGNCSVCDVLRVLYNVGRFIFMSMSGIALIMILWFAIGLIMNWGIAEEIAKAKKGILHTILALVIIILAWTLVNAIGWGFLGAQTNPFWKKGNETATGQAVWKWWEGPECGGT